MAKQITLDEVNAYYGSFRAIADVSMVVESRSITAFIGPSGCGKSTALRTINRMHEVIPGARVEGTISLDEQDSIYQDEIVPELSDDDWDGAVAGAVEGLDQAAGGTSGSSDSGDGGLSFSPVLLVLLIGLAAIFVPFVLRGARRVNRQSAGQRQQQGEASQSRYGEFADGGNVEGLPQSSQFT